MRIARRIQSAIVEVDRWVRIHFVGFSALWPILGAASVKPNLDRSDLAVLLTVTACFHIFGTLLNDAVDLPVDRHQPSRARDPLVRGVLSPVQAVAIAGAMVPGAFLAAGAVDA